MTYSLLVFILFNFVKLNAQIVFSLPKVQSEIAYLNAWNPLVLEAQGSQVIEKIWVHEGVIDTINGGLYFKPWSFKSNIFLTYFKNGRKIQDSIRPTVRLIRHGEIEITIKPLLYHFNVFGKPLRPSQVIATLPSEKYGHLGPEAKIQVMSLELEIHNDDKSVKVVELSCNESGDILENAEYQKMLEAYIIDGIKLRVNSVCVYSAFWSKNKQDLHKIYSPKVIKVDPKLFLN